MKIKKELAVNGLRNSSWASKTRLKVKEANPVHIGVKNEIKMRLKIKNKKYKRVLQLSSLNVPVQKYIASDGGSN